MIGGSPIPPPGYYPNYPQPARPAVLPQRRPAAAPAQARNRDQQPATQGRFRLQGPDDGGARANLPPLEMPSPETLGRGGESSATVEIDWTAVRKRLDAIAATGPHLQKTPSGFRFSCVVTSASGERRKVEAEAGTEAGAIDAALHGAERGE